MRIIMQPALGWNSMQYFCNNFFLTEVYYTLNDFFLIKIAAPFFFFVTLIRILVQAKITVA